MKIALVSVSIGDREFSKVTRERLESYAKIHGYDVKYFTEELDPNYAIMWQKVLALRQVLNSGDYEAVVWIDDDIYLTNLSLKLEQFMALAPDKAVITSRDIVKGNFNLHINSGLYIVRNNEIGRQHVDDLVDGYNLFDGYFRTNIFHEQTIQTYLYFTKYQNDVAVLPYGLMQSFYAPEDTRKFLADKFVSMGPHWQHGDFSIHFAGKSLGCRNRLTGLIKERDDLVAGQYPITCYDWEHARDSS